MTIYLRLYGQNNFDLIGVERIKRKKDKVGWVGKDSYGSGRGWGKDEFANTCF